MSKQEQIEEIAKIASIACAPHACCPLTANFRPCGAALEYAKAVYDAGYRKVLLDTKNGKAVDVSQYAPWELIEGHTEREVEKARKETAKEILDMLYDMGIDKGILECCRIFDVNGASLAKQICEKYGVEIEK